MKAVVLDCVGLCGCRAGAEGGLCPGRAMLGLACAPGETLRSGMGVLAPILAQDLVKIPAHANWCWGSVVGHRKARRIRAWRTGCPSCSPAPSRLVRRSFNSDWTGSLDWMLCACCYHSSFPC